MKRKHCIIQCLQHSYVEKKLDKDSQYNFCAGYVGLYSRMAAPAARHGHFDNVAQGDGKAGSLKPRQIGGRPPEVSFDLAYKRACNHTADGIRDHFQGCPRQDKFVFVGAAKVKAGVAGVAALDTWMQARVRPVKPRSRSAAQRRNGGMRQHGCVRLSRVVGADKHGKGA